MIRIFQNVPGGPLRFKSPGQEADPGPSQGQWRTSLTPLRVYKRESEAVHTVQFSAQTNRPPPMQHWKNTPLGETSSEDDALLEAALAPGTPLNLYPPYSCIRHYSPPSPSVASFKRSSSPDPSARNPPWPSKVLCCQCLWWVSEGDLILVYILIPLWVSTLNKEKDFNVQLVKDLQ